MVNFDFWWAVNIINYMYGFVYYAVVWCYVYVFKITTVCTNNNVLSMGCRVLCCMARSNKLPAIAIYVGQVLGMNN